MADVDWLAIKTEYITTDISQRKLAKKYGLAVSTIARKSTDEGWVERRERHKSNVLSKTTEKIANKEANKLARLAAATDKAIDVVVKAFDDPDQFNRYIVETTEEYAAPEIVEEEDGDSHAIGMRRWAHEKTFAKVDTKALKDLTTVLKDLTGLMRNLYGLPTQAEAEAQRIAAERLAMDKKKVESAADNTGRIEVVFAAGEDEWNE